LKEQGREETKKNRQADKNENMHLFLTCTITQ